MTLRTTTIAAAMICLAAAAHAQTSTVPEAVAPPAGTPQATPPTTTPRDGIARGVIQPARPVDPKMVTRPPAHGRGTMPVIKPPGIAR